MGIITRIVAALTAWAHADLFAELSQLKMAFMKMEGRAMRAEAALLRSLTSETSQDTAKPPAKPVANVVPVVTTTPKDPAKP